MSTIRNLLNSKVEGINCFTQCIMPDASGRIRDTAIQSMATMLLSLTSLYPNANLDKHPRICILFNNVSRFPPSDKKVHKYGGEQPEDEEDSDELDLEENKQEIKPFKQPTAQEYIKEYRSGLLESLQVHYKEKVETTFL